MSLTQSSAATPTQTTLLSPVTSTNILASSSLISSAQTNQLSKSFTSSTELSKATTASFSQSAATTPIKRTSFEFTLLSSSLSQSQLISFTQTHHYTRTPSSLTEFSTAQSMLTMTSSSMLSSFTSVLSSMTKSLSQSMMSVTYSSMPTESLSQSIKSMVTSSSANSMSESLSQLAGTSTVANFSQILLSTTADTLSQQLNSIFSTQENVQTASQSTSQYTTSSSLYATQAAMKSSFTVVTPAPSYALLYLSSSLPLPSSTPSGDGGSFSLPVIAFISVAAGFITLIVFVLFVIIIGVYLCRYVLCESHCT